MKTLKLTIFLFVLIIGTQIYAQKSNEIGIYYGLTDNDFLSNDLVGGNSYEIQSNFEIGFKYLSLISKNLKLETGINYTKLDVEIHPAPMYPPLESRFEKMEMISIPLYINYSFLKHFFINGGPMIDFNLSDTSIDSQSGIGFGFGFGGKVEFDHFLIFVNPNFKKHSLISFENSNNHRKLIEVGVQFGLSYKF